MARRFNNIYGREPGFEEKAKAAMKKLGAKKAKRYAELRTAFQEKGDDAALEAARAILNDSQNLPLGDRERLCGYLEGSRRMILPEPEALLTENPKVPGLDGDKMSKSYGNAIFLREDPAEVTKKVRTMQTDPARVRRTDPGTPEVCNIFHLHRAFSPPPVVEEVAVNCRTAAGGCLDCKKVLFDNMNAELTPIRHRAAELKAAPAQVTETLAAGGDRCRALAGETMREVRGRMGLD